jgi:histone acetyltransferase (RNA polymerase elongator complex component)
MSEEAVAAEASDSRSGVEVIAAMDQPLALPHGTSDCLFTNGATRVL